MGKRQVFTEAQIRRFIRAGRAEDPDGEVELETDAGFVRFRRIDQNHAPAHAVPIEGQPEPWT